MLTIYRPDGEIEFETTEDPEFCTTDNAGITDIRWTKPMFKSIRHMTTCLKVCRTYEVDKEYNKTPTRYNVSFWTDTGTLVQEWKNVRHFSIGPGSTCSFITSDKRLVQLSGNWHADQTSVDEE